MILHREAQYPGTLFWTQSQKVAQCGRQAYGYYCIQLPCLPLNACDNSDTLLLTSRSLKPQTL